MKIAITALFTLLTVAPDDATAQSLWQKGKQRHVNFVADNRAMKIGDVVTIVIDERQSVRNNEKVKTEKSSDVNASVTSFTPEQSLAEKVLPIEWTAQRDFEGKADFDKQGSFTTNISASVIDVQPNGNLVVQGRRKVILDGEEKWMTVSGVVRQFDVSNDNTVESFLVANATVKYESSGRLAQNTKRGWFDTILDYLWPF